MFWTSITDGIGILFSHWEIWIGILIYGTIFVTYSILFRLGLSSGGANGGTQVAGSLTHLIVGPALQGILVSFLVTAILPILWGGEEIIPLSFLTENWWAITKAGLISIVITILISLIPIVGSFISNTPGTTIFVQGVIVFHMLADKMLFEVLVKISPSSEILPDFWTSIGFLIFSIVIANLVPMGLIMLLFLLRIINDNSMESMLLVVGNFIGVIPGILCLCIYSSYIRLTILNITSTITSG
jgi:hypothetical protein